MNIHPLEQRTKEWLDFKSWHISSTDASAIFETNPYLDCWKLFDHRYDMIPPIVENDAMRRGSLLEDEALHVLSMDVGIEFKPAVVTHDVYKWMMASLDGLSYCGRFVGEIKCPGVKNHEKVIRGELPDYWYTQCQHHIKTVEALMCYFMSYRPEHEIPFKIIKIYPDDEYIEKMVSMEKEFFYDNLCKIKRPEEPWKLQTR